MDIVYNFKIYGKNPPSGQSFLAFGNVGLILSFRFFWNIYFKIEKTIQASSKNLLYAEDKDLIYKLEEQAEAGFIPQVLYKYRYVKESATHSQEKRNLGAKNSLTSKRSTAEKKYKRSKKKNVSLFIFFNLSVLWFAQSFFYPCFLLVVAPLI